MKEMRSRSQILFGFLPEQTVDLRGRVWKVKEWQDPIRRAFEDGSLRQALRVQIARWAAEGTDGGFSQDLIRGLPIEVRSLDMDAGVRVESFPNIWVCKRCQRVTANEHRACECGARGWGQFHFVGYHDCGALRAPFIPKCNTHQEVKVVFPGTASAAEIRFVCPVCNRQLRKGLGMPNCECGNGRMQFTVHRAASVFTPRSVVLVNPPSPERVRDLVQAGGPARALSWILEGLETDSFADLPLSQESLEQQLVAQGLSQELAATMARQAATAGEIQSDAGGGFGALEGERLDAAQREAVTVGIALAESRIRVKDLVQRTEAGQPLGDLYRSEYPPALARARIEDVELLDQLPILTGVYGYTRGDATPGKTRLVPFTSRRGHYVIYGDIAKTEALFVRLEPLTVARWLQDRGYDFPSDLDARGARLTVLERAVIPTPGEELEHPALGGELLTLVHSFAHRFVRQTALLSGIERNSLSELLVPLHLGFFVYAAARGDFVLGGLQAVFEGELASLLTTVVDDERRCPLDPGCSKGGGACMACLHLGEPSCRYYNRYLDRSALWGPGGYLES